MIKFETLENKLMTLRDTFVLLDSDVAQLYDRINTRGMENLSNQNSWFHRLPFSKKF